MRAGNSSNQHFDKDLVRQSFDLASATYHQFTALQRVIGDRLMDQSKPLDCSRLDVLDVGAGTGYLTRALSQLSWVNQLHALDISPAMLHQTRLNMHGSSAVALICADAENLPLQNATLNAVYSNLAYQWCSKLQQAFKEVHRVMRQGGMFALSTFGEKTLFELKDAWRVVDQSVHVNAFVEEQVVEYYLKAAGFREVTVISETILMHYETPKHLMLDLKGMGAHNINQGRNQGLTGVNGFKLLLEKYESMRTEKGIPATFQAVYGYAKK